MLKRNYGSDQPTGWNDLTEGAPTIIGLANLCGMALTRSMNQSAELSDENLLVELSDEAKTILAAAADRGTLDIRANRDSIDSADRFLAICVEFKLDEHLLFLQKSDPQQTVRFLDGFRQLCEHGLVLHHLQKDFSLSARGFTIAKSLNREDYADRIAFAVELEH